MKKTLCTIMLLILAATGSYSQNVGINSTGSAPDANAGLDVNFVNKGVLIPRVALTGTSSFAPLAAHVAGMTVYNTATAGDVTPGFYYNNGTRWVASIPAGISAGDMLYWNGAAWVRVPAGSPGQFLQFSPASIPTWTGSALASIATTAASGVLDVTATSGGNITSDGGSSILSRGVCWKTTTGPTISDSKTTDGLGLGVFTSILTGLTASTTYYVRAYAINNSTVSYGNEIFFTTTTPTLPVLDPTTAATAVTATTATSGGNLTSNGNAAITARGICYATTNPPTIADAKVIDGSTTTGSFTSNMTGLTSNTVYYVRSYATNSVGTGYGAVISFTTQAIVSSTTAPTLITSTGATTGGAITAGGGAAISQRGVCWGPTLNPDITGSKTSDGTGTGTFISTLTGLTYTTLYHVRAYATNAGGTVYGNDVTFTTLSPVVPTLAATTAATAITGNSANSGGNVTSDGGAPITERGVCYGITSTPTTANSKVINPSPGTGSFVSSISGLTGGTTYYVRAYAINLAGTAYGAQISFKTLITPPTLTTVAASNIGAASATSGGSMVWNGPGYSNYQAYGVAYSTTPNAATPTKVATNSTNFAYNGTPIAPWVTNLAGLAANTTYYIRSYLDVYPSGTGPWITVYGNELSFTTTAPTAPVVTSTTAVTVTSANNATSGGAITTDGGSPITAKGVCWSTSAAPTLGASNFTSNGTGTTSFSSSVTGLTASTLYYLRAYATNSIGTSYGPVDVSFTTWIQSPYVLGQNVGYGYCAYVTPLGTGYIVSYDISPTPPATTFKWGASGIAVGASAALGSGQNNTNLILAADPVTRPIAASVANDYSVTYNGKTYDDWYLPSAGEWALLAAYPVYTMIGLGFSTNMYYTSSEYSSLTYATAYFQNGSQPYSSGANRMTDTYTHFLRVIRNFSPPVVPTVTTTAVTGITGTTAVSGGNVTNDGGVGVTARGVCWSTTTGPTTADPKTADGTGSGVFASNITGLALGTTYYVRAYATNSVGTAYGLEVTFTTLNIPTLTTTAVSSIAGTTATSGGTISSDGGAAVTVRGICWSTTTGPTTANSITTNGTGTGTFTSSMTGLTIGTLYYVRAYATNAEGTAYGNEVTFTTLTIPTVTTTAVTSIATTTATSGGNVTSNGGGSTTVSARGVCWSTTTGPTTANSKTTNGAGPGTFLSNITGLTSGVTYYVRAYATNTYGTAYGNEISFITLSVATVTTSPVTITLPTAATGGNVTYDGGTAVTARGVVWALTTGPTVGTHLGITSNGTGTGVYTSALATLASGTTYYLRAYATNTAGTSYGSEIAFVAPGLAILTTTTATNIAVTAATSGGDVTSDGGSTVSARGVCWNTTGNPTTVDPSTSDGTGTGIFVSSITGLTQGTLYYVRAYATNTTGTSYGTQTTFTTPGTSAPVVTTAAATAITTTTATTGGNVTSDGNVPVTARGVCYGIIANPTLADAFTTDGAGTGAFVSSLTGLTPGTTYYVRAYATNTIGTSYGTQVSFPTTGIPPTVTTDQPTLPTSSSCLSGGDVTSDGGSTVTARGVVWSATSFPPTLADPHTTNGTGTGLFTSNVTGLTPGFYYTIIAYATNSHGTSYGNEVYYMPVGAPTVTTEPIYYVSPDAFATCGGQVISDGGSVLTASGVVWNTSASPTITTHLGITNDNTLIGWYSSTLTGLVTGTTYYVRAYATNTDGFTSYGVEIIFTPGVPGLATVTTNPVINKIGAIAEGGATILSDGGDFITATGLCWSLTANPTITTNLGITIENFGSGTFNSILTGLSVGTTYHVRAYATNAIGTAYGADMTFTETAAFIGQFISGGTMFGNVFSIDATGLHGYITDPWGTIGSDWGCTNTSVATGTALGTGFANTAAIISDIAVNGCITASPYFAFAPEVCKWYGPDWYLPSKDEFNLLLTNQVAAGVAPGLAAAIYPIWCSSQVDATHVWYYSGTAWVNTGLKTDQHTVWPIRSF